MWKLKYDTHVQFDRILIVIFIFQKDQILNWPAPYLPLCQSPYHVNYFSFSFFFGLRSFIL